MVERKRERVRGWREGGNMEEKVKNKEGKGEDGREGKEGRVEEEKKRSEGRKE